MVSEAVELVLVASTRNCCLETMYSARVMATVSAAGGGAGGVIVSRAVLVRPPKLAEIVAEVDAVTDTVVTVNVALVAPAGTVTLPPTGTLTTALLLERVTSAPPVGAVALNVTVATEELPPTTLVGFSPKPDTVRGGGGAGGETVSRAVLVTPPKEAEMVAEVDAVTDTVVTLNVVLVLPAGTVTLPIAGTLATAVLLLKRVTTAPPVGAAALKVTVPVEDAGPTTLVGLSASVESVTGGGGAGSETVSSAVLVRPPKEAEIMMVVDAVTEVVVTLKLAVVVPAATVTLAGTVATRVLLLERVTAVAAEGAGLMLTVPCKVLPPATVAGVSVTLLRAGGALGVQPDNVACVELPPPFTVTTQVGELNGCTWIWKAPAASALPSAAPSTKITWLGRAPLPSRRSCPALSSARVIVGGGAEGAGGATVSPAVRVAVPSDAMMVTGVDAVTELAVTVKLALLAPPGMVTLAATLATDVLLLERVTSAPPAGAAALKVTVPVEDAGPTTLVGLSAMVESVTAGGGGGGGVTVSGTVRVTPPKDAKMVAELAAATGEVDTVKVALVAPAAIVTLAGTLATAALLLESDTTAGLGVTAAKVTVPVEELPPTTLVGLTVTALRTDAAGEFTVIGAKRIVPPSVAVSWTVVGATLNVVTVKLALVAPAATVTLAGTLAEPGRLLDRVTTVPPVGTALASVTVPVAGLPPVTLLGLTLNEESAGGGGGVPAGFTVKVADWVTPPPETEIVTTVCTVTALVKRLKPPVVTPAGIMTLLFTEATAGRLLVS